MTGEKSKVEPRYHTLKVTMEGLELAQLRELIAKVEEDLALLKSHLPEYEKKAKETASY
jgi:hypothetical protein